MVSTAKLVMYSTVPEDKESYINNGILEVQDGFINLTTLAYTDGINVGGERFDPYYFDAYTHEDGIAFTSDRTIKSERLPDCYNHVNHYYWYDRGTNNFYCSSRRMYYYSPKDDITIHIVEDILIINGVEYPFNLLCGITRKRLYYLKYGDVFMIDWEGEVIRNRYIMRLPMVDQLYVGDFQVSHGNLLTSSSQRGQIIYYDGVKKNTVRGDFNRAEVIDGHFCTRHGNDFYVYNHKGEHISTVHTEGISNIHISNGMFVLIKDHNTLIYSM